MELPSLATTGIGSLPPMEWERAREEIFSLDIPYLPTFPQEGVQEGLLGELHSGILPQALKLFLTEREVKRPFWTKIQWPGPHSLTLLPESDRREAKERYFDRLRALLSAFPQRREGLVFFLDEPGLGVETEGARVSGECWDMLEKALDFLVQEGVVSGLHCCSDAPWDRVLDLPCKILSFDVALSLKSLGRGPLALTEFHRRGGRLALGLVPTQIPADWFPERVCEALIENLWQVLGPEMGEEVLARSLLSPACGLGLRSVGECQLVFNELKHVQKILRERLKK